MLNMILQSIPLGLRLHGNLRWNALEQALGTGT